MSTIERSISQYHSLDIQKARSGLSYEDRFIYTDPEDETQSGWDWVGLGE